MLNKLQQTQNIPLRVLTEQEFHNLLCKVTLCVFIVLEKVLCINYQLFNLQKLSNAVKQSHSEIEFRHFKQLVLALFGNNLFTMSVLDIDSVLRKVHKELLI